MPSTRSTSEPPTRYAPLLAPTWPTSSWRSTPSPSSATERRAEHSEAASGNRTSPTPERPHPRDPAFSGWLRFSSGAGKILKQSVLPRDPNLCPPVTTSTVEEARRMIIWTGWGILVPLFITLGAGGVGLLAEELFGVGAGSNGALVGALLAAFAIFLLGRRLNKPEQGYH